MLRRRMYSLDPRATLPLLQPRLKVLASGPFFMAVHRNLCYVLICDLSYLEIPELSELDTYRHLYFSDH